MVKLFAGVSVVVTVDTFTVDRFRGISGDELFV